MLWAGQRGARWLSAVWAERWGHVRENYWSTLGRAGLATRCAAAVHGAGPANPVGSAIIASSTRTCRSGATSRRRWPWFGAAVRYCPRPARRGRGAWRRCSPPGFWSIRLTSRRRGLPMAVLMIGEVPNLTEEIYAGMIGQMQKRAQSRRVRDTAAGLRLPIGARGAGSPRSAPAFDASDLYRRTRFTASMNSQRSAFALATWGTNPLAWRAPLRHRGRHQRTTVASSAAD
jgi:hypothetical protein